MEIVTHRTGRPTRLASEERSKTILRVAAELFRERGFAGTSIEQIASTARVGKHTLYRRYASKEALFLAVVHEEFRLLNTLFVFDDKIEHSSPIDHLKAYCIASLKTALDPWIISLYRVGIGEAGRFPDLAARLREEVIDDAVDTLTAPIMAAQRAKQIIECDPARLSRYIVMAINGEPFLRALMGADDYPGGTTFDEYFEYAWSTTMLGVFTRP